MGSPLTAAALGVPEVFNAAEYFVDRHVVEGRGGRVAIECGDAARDLRRPARTRQPVRIGAARPTGGPAGGTGRAAPARRPGVRRSASSGRSRSARCQFPSTRSGRRPTTATRSPIRRPVWSSSAANFFRSWRRSRRSDLPALRHVVVVDEGGAFDALLAARIADARCACRQPRCTGVLAVLVGQHGAARKGACTCSTTCSSARSSSRRACSASPRPIAVSASPSCSSPTASGTRATSRSPSARPAFSGPGRRSRRTSSRRSSGTGRPCSSRCRPATRCCWRTTGHSISRRSVWRYRRAKRCRPPSTIASGSDSASRSSMASDRPRRSTCSSRTGRTRPVPARAASSSTATKRAFSTMRAFRSRTGEIGNLWISGDSTCAYYWNQHEKSKTTFQGEWLRTGDKYSQDADGFFCYAGRSDDMLKVGGLWVSPVEVENALIEHPAVQECGVVGRDDRDGLTKPAAFVVLAVRTAAEPGARGGTAAVRPPAACRVQAAAVGRIPARVTQDRHGQDSAIPPAAVFKVETAAAFCRPARTSASAAGRRGLAAAGYRVRRPLPPDRRLRRPPPAAGGWPAAGVRAAPAPRPPISVTYWRPSSDNVIGGPIPLR